ncbi:MAG: D-ala-D-ala transporter subunit, partial [Firmicutes bacterium]|nr:D-ala-D-ala transporter subunit [Bacillota bacterium]
RFKKSPLSLVGLFIILFMVAVALLGPTFVPYPQDATGKIDMAMKLMPPSRLHLFGTDEVGGDVFTRTVLGAQVSLQVGFIVLTVAIGIGVTLGAIAGFLGGWVGEVIMRITDVFFTIPSLILALAVAAALGPSLRNVMLAVSLVWWPGYCRLVHGEVLKLKQENYVVAARSMGASKTRMILRHILPNCASPIIVKASLDMGYAILTAAGLGYIGVGVQPPTPEWGAMISVGRAYMPKFWWAAVFPGIAIFLTVVGFNLLGDGLRDVFDPKGQR